MFSFSVHSFLDVRVCFFVCCYCVSSHFNVFFFLVNRYILDDLSVKVKVLPDWFIVFMSFFSWFGSCFFTFQNFMFFTSSVNSGSKATSSFTGGGILKMHNPYLYWLFFSFLVSWKIAFHLIRLIIISIFTISCSWVLDRFLEHYILLLRGFFPAFQRVFNNSCDLERWYIQRTDEENTIHLVLRVSCYQSSAK